MKRDGISLIEVLVVAALISILIAILLPAVQYARESGRRTQCSSNLRQLALALHQYEGAHRALPHFSQNNYAFHVSLLPYLDRKALHQQIDFSLNAMNYRGPLLYERVFVFECPSDASRNRLPQFPAVTNYHGNWGTGALKYGNNGIFSYYDYQPEFVRFLPFSAITDGLSETAMIAEVLAADDSRQGLRAYWNVSRRKATQFEEFAQSCKDEGSSGLAKSLLIPRGRPWLEGGMNWILYNHILPPNSASCANGGDFGSGAFTSTSFHGELVNVAMADGRIQAIRQSIGINVWRAIGSRAGDP